MEIYVKLKWYKCGLESYFTLDCWQRRSDFMVGISEDRATNVVMKVTLIDIGIRNIYALGEYAHPAFV